MLSPDVPEFVPRGFQTSNAVVSTRGDSKAVKHVPRGFQTSNADVSARGDSNAVKHVPRGFQTSDADVSARGDSNAVKHAPRGFQTSNAVVSAGGNSKAPQESSRGHGSQSQPSDTGHNHLNSRKFSWRNVSRNTSPKEGGERSGKPRFKRYGNTVRGISNGHVSQSEGNSRNAPQSADNWRNTPRSKDSSVEKTTKGDNGRRKFNLNISEGRNSSGKYHKVKHDPGKGRGKFWMNNDHASSKSLKDKANPTVQEEEHPCLMPPPATHNSVGLSYGNIVRSNSNKDNLQKTKPVAVPEMSFLLDDQWPTLGDTCSQAFPWVKRNVGSNSSQNATNAWSVEKSDSSVKERNNSKENPWQVKVLNRPTDEKVAPKVDRVKDIQNKSLGNDEKCKNMVTEIKSEESSGKETRGCGKSNSAKVVHDRDGRANTKMGKDEQTISIDVNSLHEKQDSSTRRDIQDVSTLQEQNQSDESHSKPTENDPFQWQVKVDKKRRTKTKDSYDDQDKLDKSGDVLLKYGSKDSGRKMSQEGYRKYKKDAASCSLQLKNSSTDRIGSRKKRERKELVRKSTLKDDREFKEDASRRESHIELEKVQNSVQDTVSVPVKHSDNSEIPVPVERAAISVLEHQKRLVGEKVTQKKKLVMKKIKEEKMRKKEEKLLKARELKKLDSKVTMVTRDFLESTLFGSTSRRKANSSISSSQKLKLFSEEYPSLVKGGTVASRVAFDEDIFETTLGESDDDDDASVTDEPEADSDLSAAESGGALQTVSDEPNVSALPAGVPSYSGALLATKRNVGKKSSPQKVKLNIPTEVTSTTVQKKKVKTNDLIELDLMAAAVWSKKNKRKALTDTKEASKELTTRKRTTALGSPVGSGKNTRGTTTPSVHTKAKEVTNLKRGKQREGQKKKKVSHLKKCMKRARQLEVEALLSILQEAKKAQEKSASSDTQEIRTPTNLPFLSEVETTVTESPGSENDKELMTVSTSLDMPSDKGLCINEDHNAENVDERCDVDSNDEQKENYLKNVLAELSHSEVSDHINKSVSVSVNELTTEVHDGKCEPEIQVNVKDSSEVILEADSTLKEKETLDLCLKPMYDDMSLTVPSETLTSNSENKTGLDIGALDQEKIAMEKSLTLVHNILECHDDSEISKKFVDFAEELRALQNPVHKKKFREYCNHVITPEVDSVAKELVESLVSFQTRHFQRDPTKARIRRRYVCGLKETTKLMGKMSCIVVAPDIQRSKGPGALDEVVEKMLEQARNHGVPVIFALSCKRLGKLCLKKVPVSCFGIINYQGAQDKFQTLMQLVPEAQKQYQELVACGNRSLPVDDEELISKESEPERLDVNKEVIAKTIANISGAAEE